MIGAEVDFYVEGVDAQELIPILQSYYEEPFQRYTKNNLNVRTPAWYNKEVFIKLYLPDEGRDKDNQHTLSYIGIQVRHDRDKNQPVRFEAQLSEAYLRN